MCVHRYKNRVLKRQMIKHITYARLLWRYNKVNQQRKVYVARQKTKRNDKKVHATDALFVQRLYFINILCYFYVKYRIRYLPCNMKCNKLVALVTKIWKKKERTHTGEKTAKLYSKWATKTECKRFKTSTFLNNNFFSTWTSLLL